MLKAFKLHEPYVNWTAKKLSLPLHSSGRLRALNQNPLGVRSWTADKRLVLSKAESTKMGTEANWLFIDKFAWRQFEGGHAAQLQVDKDEFIEQLHAKCRQVKRQSLCK